MPVEGHIGRFDRRTLLRVSPVNHHAVRERISRQAMFMTNALRSQSSLGRGLDSNECHADRLIPKSIRITDSLGSIDHASQNLGFQDVSWI